MISLNPNELIIDSFAGGGGASQGIFMATGRHPDIAINHNAEAVAMHKANHPATRHYCQSIYHVDPDDIIREQQRPIGLAWFSPDCTHHSKARGGKPKEKHIRDLAWVVVHWAERAVWRGKRPRVICVENVEEFKEWGPLLDDGQPCPLQKGFEFQRWVKALRKLGYKVDWRELRACDYGAPTIRKRLFIIARCDGVPIAWPEQTHGPGRALPYRTAAECIDWSIPCPSIFERKRPLAENTLRRIAKGIKRYVIDAAEPFIVRLNHGDSGGRRTFGLDEPLKTITHSLGDALVAPTLIEVGYGEAPGQAPRAPGLDKPLGTVVAGGVKHALVSGFLAGVGGRAGQSPERSVEKPVQTITAKADAAIVAPLLVGAGGPAFSGKPKPADAPINTLTTENHCALVSAFLAQHNGTRVDVNPGRAATQPLSTITQEASQQQLVASHLLKLHGTCKDGQPIDEPMATIRAQGLHIGEVRAFLIKYFGTDQDPRLEEPLHTVTAKDRFGLVTVAGEEYLIADIGMRMLSPRELYRAQGFPDSYTIAPLYNGKPLTKTAQVHMCGNSVSPPNAAAIVRAQFSQALAITA